jgi:hypothetical protein
MICYRKCARTHRIGGDLAGVVKSDVLPALIDAISATIGPKVGRGDEDGFGDGRLEPRIWPTWRGGCARGEA